MAPVTGVSHFGVAVTGDKTQGVMIAAFDSAPAVLVDVRHDQRGTN